MAQPRFGELLWQAVMQVKASKGRSITSIKRELAERCYVGVGAVEKWKKRSIPATETIEILGRWGYDTAGMERVWLRAFLRAGEYYDGGALEQELFGEDRSALPPIRDNLPPLRSDFIGRTVEIGRVRKGLAMPHPLVSIEGIGGVGKTTLAIKVARLCKSGEINDEQTNSYDKIAPFEAIVWISAKDKPNEDLSLSDVLDAVAGVLNYTIVRQLQGDEKRAAVDRLLRVHRSLLIVDNFETVTDVKLADFLQSIPPPSKAIITTRERQLRRLWDVPLAGLSEKEGFQKIRDYSYSLGLRAVAHADDTTLRPLYSITEGNPKAIEMALGYIKYKGMALDEVVHSLAEANETVYDLFQDLFARAWQLLSQEGQRLLMVMPFFADSANRDAIEAAADVHGWYLRAGIAQLIEMSLLETNEELVEARKRYSAHPLVIAFAGAKLREEPEFEVEARERWSEYFLEFARHHLVSDNSFGRYWNSIPVGVLTLVDLESSNLLNVLAWAEQQAQGRLLIELMIIFAHYMDDHLILIPKRLQYAQKAAEDANRLGQKIDEALLRIDALGWTLLEVGRFAEATQEIIRGLHIAKNLASNNLIALAYAFLSGVYLEQDDILQASSIIDKAMSLDSLPIVRIRVYMMAGNVAHKKDNHSRAIELYKKAVQINLEYGGEHEIMDIRYDLGLAYLAQGNIQQAEAEFNSLKQHEVTIKQLRARFGLARIAQAKGNPNKAHQLAQKMFDDLSRLLPSHRLLKEVTDFLHSLDESE